MPFETATQRLFLMSLRLRYAEHPVAIRNRCVSAFFGFLDEQR